MSSILALLAGAAKPKGKGKKPMGYGDTGDDDMMPKSPGENYAGEAFDALKDDDREGFVQAIMALCGKGESMDVGADGSEEENEDQG